MKKTVLRAIIFLVAAGFAVQALPLITAETSFRETAAVLPALSPFASVCSATARRAVDIFSILGLPILLIAFLKGRWFCFHVCPTGFVSQTLSRLRPSVKKKFAGWPELGQWIAILGFGSAAAGYPLFLWLDPLCIFNGVFDAWRRPMLWTAPLLGTGMVMIIAISILRPNLWCERLCPLGATQLLIGRLGRRVRGTLQASPENASMARRSFLGLCAGLVGGLFLPRVLGVQRSASESLPIRPPGSVSESLMGALCQRCGNCIRACPTRIIVPALGEGGLGNLLSPVVRIGIKGFEDEYQQYCYEGCNECNKVCPTGAISRLSMEEKKETAIGVARIDKSRCIAWADGGWCMVCDEYCPYQAIKEIDNDGVPCPEVVTDVCRGCGLCQVNCPAMPEKAIVVHGILQKKVGA